MGYKDKEKQKEYLRAYQKNHRKDPAYRKEELQRIKLKKKRLKEWVNQIKLLIGGCERCGERDIACLDFHHTNESEKLYEISRLLSDCAPKEKILAEMSKCELICCNCHRKHHRDNRNIIFVKPINLKQISLL